MSDCIFCRIVQGEIPARRILETEELLAFPDISPQAPVHVLIIPRRHIPGNNAVEEADAQLVGRLFIAARRLARDLGVADSGYRLLFNCGPDALQTVPHLHLHLLGGRPLAWPPG